MIASGQHHLRTLEQTARTRLQNEGLQIAAPQTAVRHVCRFGHQCRNFCAVLAGAKLRQLIFTRLGVGEELFHGPRKVFLGVLTPSVVLVDHVERVDLDVFAFEVTRQRHVVHGRVRCCSEHIVVFVVFKNTRCTAVIQNEEFFHFLGHWGYCQTVARTHITHHGIDLVAVVQVAHLLNLFGSATVFVNVNGFNFHAAKTRLVVWRRRSTFVECVNHNLGAIDSGNTKAIGCLSRQEAHNTDLESFLRLHRATECGGHGHCSDDCLTCSLNCHLSLHMFALLGAT